MQCPHLNCSEVKQVRGYRLVKCSHCQLIFKKSGEKINYSTLYRNYYRNEISGRFYFGIENIIKLLRLVRAFKIYAISPAASSILDIGSGRGFTLYFLRKHFGFAKTVGTQISKPAVNFSKDKLGLKIYAKDLLWINFKKEKFDLVTIWHVLEHIHDPERYIKKIHRLLNKDGLLIIEVPNFNSWTRILTGPFWLGFDWRYHLSFFTPPSLIKLLQKYKFRIRKTHTFSLEYSTFTSTQSFLSLLTRTDQMLFKWLQFPKFKPQIVLHIVLFLLISPLCFLVNTILYFSQRGEVLLVVAQKK